MTLSTLLPEGPKDPCPPVHAPLHGSLPADDRDELDGELDRFAGLMPPAIGKMLAYTQRPGSFVYRLPLALLFVAGGLLGFLPVLGFWMIPFGLMLVAQDIRPLRPRLARLLELANEVLARHRHRAKGRAGGTRPRLCVRERAFVACATDMSRRGAESTPPDGRPPEPAR